MAEKSSGRGAKIGAITFTVLALIFTGLTALLLAQVMGSSAAAGERTQPVLVAKRTIPAAQRINEEDLRLIEWPASAIPEGAFSAMDQLLGPKARVPVNTIFAGEPVLKQRLASPELGTGMASLVPTDRRAFPVPVDRWVTEARLVYPGAFVDVLTTLRIPGERRSNTKLVLQRIRVLAVDGAVDAAELASRQQGKKKRSAANRRSVVTLLVRPDQAEVLALASREGKLDLVLRRAGDEAEVDTLGLTVTELIGQADPKAVEAALKSQKALKESVSNERPRKRPVRRPKRNRGRRGTSSSTKTINIGAE